MKILDWFEKHGRKNLPWQGKNLYHVWISEIMLQQTQVSKVIDYFNNFITKFPSLRLLALADIQEVLACWSGLGYYNRARNLHKTAQICAREHKGKLPKELLKLIELPGIGRTTAGAILSLAENLSYPILDGNVKRVMSRAFAISADKNSVLDKKLWKIATELVPQNSAKKYNQALMDLGSMVCTRSKPLCQQCPLMKQCSAYQLNQVDLYPQKKVKTKQIEKIYHALMLVNNNKVFLQQREAEGIWPLLWFLPLFDSEEAMLSVKQLRINNKIKISNFAITHVLTHRKLDLRVFCINSLDANFDFKIDKLKNNKGQWIELSEFKRLPHPTALTKIIQYYQTKVIKTDEKLG
ncbi:MAG: A/G-specific adenine glycosylase [Alcanivoracaceae bacterium]|nr:A/G-specific adenine glycosylase [Alcanivoracaceae bacterium]